MAVDPDISILFMETISSSSPDNAVKAELRRMIRKEFADLLSKMMAELAEPPPEECKAPTPLPGDSALNEMIGAVRKSYFDPENGICDPRILQITGNHFSLKPSACEIFPNFLS